MHQFQNVKAPVPPPLPRGEGISRTTRYLSSDNSPDVVTIQALSKASCSKKVDKRQPKAPDECKRVDNPVEVGTKKKLKPCGDKTVRARRKSYLNMTRSCAPGREVVDNPQCRLEED